MASDPRLDRAVRLAWLELPRLRVAQPAGGGGDPLGLRDPGRAVPGHGLGADRDPRVGPAVAAAMAGGGDSDPDLARSRAARSRSVLDRRRPAAARPGVVPGRGRGLGPD